MFPGLDLVAVITTTNFRDRDALVLVLADRILTEHVLASVEP